MKKKYDKEVREGKPAKNGRRNKKNQTRWVFYDRETLEKLLAQADPDPKKGGIQFYFTEYTEETAKKYYPEEYEKVVGSLTLVLCAANLEGNIPKTISLKSAEVTYENKGQLCPPSCEPDPTDI